MYFLKAAAHVFSHGCERAPSLPNHRGPPRALTEESERQRVAVWGRHWCGLSKKAENLRIGHFSLSLSQGSNAHISSSSRPLSRVPRYVLFRPLNAEQPPAFIFSKPCPPPLPLSSPLPVFVHRSELFFFSCFAFFWH